MCEQELTAPGTDLPESGDRPRGRERPGIRERLRLECPTCSKRYYVLREAVPAHPTLPFCSSRCRLLDLSRWFDESYRIADPTIEAD